MATGLLGLHEQLWRRHVAQWTAWAPQAGVAIRATWPPQRHSALSFASGTLNSTRYNPKLRKRAR